MLTGAGLTCSSLLPLSGASRRGEALSPRSRPSEAWSRRGPVEGFVFSLGSAARVAPLFTSQLGRRARDRPRLVGSLAHRKPRGRASWAFGHARSHGGRPCSRSRGRRVARWGTRRERRPETVGAQTRPTSQQGVDGAHRAPRPDLVFIS